MKKKFNLSDYQKLLEMAENNKIVFLDDKFIKLLEYKCSISDQIAYERRVTYFLLIDKYLNQSISIHELEHTLKEMKENDIQQRNIILNDFQKLENFYISKDAYTLSDLVSTIYQICCDNNISWDKNTKPMSDSELWHLINDCYLQLQKTFPFENFSNQAYKHLISRSFKFLILTLGLLQILFLNYYVKF